MKCNWCENSVLVNGKLQCENESCTKTNYGLDILAKRAKMAGEGKKKND